MSAFGVLTWRFGLNKGQGRCLSSTGEGVAWLTTVSVLILKVI